MTEMSSYEVDALLRSTGLCPQNAGQGVSHYYATTSDGVYMIRVDGEQRKVWFGRWRRNASERSMRNEWWNGDIPYGHCRMRSVKID